MKGNSFSYVILLASLAPLAIAEFFSSTHEITKLAEYERFLLRKMERFVALNENKLDFLKEKLQEFEGEREDSSVFIESNEYFENPINKYLLTKRLSVDWERMENFLQHEMGISTLKGMDKVRGNFTFPKERDFDGAVEGLLRLQRIYRLNAKDMAEGILAGVKYASTLSSKDCYDIGKFALKENELLAAHAWFLEALKGFINYEPSGLDEKFEKADILDSMAEVKYKLSDFRGAAEMAYELTQWRPNERTLEMFYHYNRHALSKPSYRVETEHEPIPDDLSNVDEYAAYRLTCSGHIHPTPGTERELRCGYLTETHPFLQLAPIKVEELHLDPLLLIFHDVIYDTEIQKIIALANGKIQRATVVSTNGSVVSNVRTSQFVFLEKELDKVLETIDIRVADMTGLNMAAAEKHQVANYGIGGHYAQHHDFFHKMYLEVANGELGNRIATVLFYLTDVEQGGGTAFPYFKRLVKPEKGAAAFWFNLHASGDGDEWTKHGACPVLVGSKWVLNRWIRERGQEFKRPCELFRDTQENSILF